MVESRPTPTFVLVHGAWADGSSWRKVIEGLQAGGATAIAAPIPLATLSDDGRALDRGLARIDGPVVLAAHAYAGALIAARRTSASKAWSSWRLWRLERSRASATCSSGPSRILRRLKWRPTRKVSSGCRTVR